MLFFTTITVLPGHVVLACRGDTVTTLEPGRHLVRTPHSARSIDMRERLVPVAAQEVLTADAMSVRVSMSLRIRVTDPVAFVDRVGDLLDTIVQRGVDSAVADALSASRALATTTP